MNLATFRRRSASAAAVVTVPAVIAVLALVNPGFPLARVDLNDGGVWLTATSSLQLGRFNAQVENLKGAVGEIGDTAALAANTTSEAMTAAASKDLQVDAECVRAVGSTKLVAAG